MILSGQDHGSAAHLLRAPHLERQIVHEQLPIYFAA